MNKSLLVTLFIGLLFGSLRAADSQYVPGQVLIQLQPGASPQKFIAEMSASGYAFELLESPSIPWNIHLFSFPSGISDQQVLPLVKACKAVRLAQFNHYVNDRFTEPDDPNYTNGDMWDMHNTGQNGGLADADIDAPEAWSISTGGLTSLGDTIVVAVIDGNVSLTHNDLNFWKNYQEIPSNSIDDDQNGYLDDFNGWNAVGNNSTVTGSSSNHATHVSGTVGARGNNSLGVTGVNWNVKVMPIRGSSGNEAVVVAAYSYAASHRRLFNQTNGAQGAFVVSTNSSFGVDNGDPANYPLWSAMYDSMGVLGILSAGATANANYNIDQTGDIPTACPSDYLITVTNTTRTDAKASSAGYGLTTIDLGAPGSSITSTTPNNSYGSSSGTSMATPHVAGAVALMLSAACPQLIQDYKQYPDSIALILKDYLLQSTDTIPALVGASVTGGRLNIHKALLALDAYPCLATKSAEQITSGNTQSLTVFPNPSSGSIEIKYSLPQDLPLNALFYDLSGREVSRLNLGLKHAGFHSHLIECPQTESGVYYIQLRSGDEVISGSRIAILSR